MFSKVEKITAPPTKLLLKPPQKAFVPEIRKSDGDSYFYINELLAGIVESNSLVP